MIRAKFVVNPKFLVLYTLTECSSDRFIAGVPASDVVTFQNRAWQLDSDAYQFLRYGVNGYHFAEHFLEVKSIKDMLERAERLVDEMLNDPAFAPVKRQTDDASVRIEKEWTANYDATFELMSELTGLQLDHEFTVCITHPSQKTGRNADPFIYWTDRNDFPHYNTVYLWHEIMHSFIKPLKANEGIYGVSHAVIELLADNELRVRLNGGDYPPLEGHSCLHSLKENLLPSWREYTRGKRKLISNYLEHATEAFSL